MTVQELIDELQKVEDKTLEVVLSHRTHIGFETLDFYGNFNKDEQQGVLEIRVE